MSIQRTPAERKRIFELVGMVFTTTLLLAISRLETRLFDLSESLARNHDFVTTVIYFGTVNLNVILILLLAFLIFRNVAKLVLERRRGVLGSRLRSKLVVVLVFFALAPTTLVFVVSTGFISRSFDQWFSERVRTTMQQTREAGAMMYRQDQRRLESLARIALNRIVVTHPPLLKRPSRSLHPSLRNEGVGSTNESEFNADTARIDTKHLSGFDGEYGLHAVRVYDVAGKLLWTSQKKDLPPIRPPLIAGEMFVLNAIDRFQHAPSVPTMSAVEGEDKQDVVKGVAPIFDLETGNLLGVVLAEERLETRILKSIETILQGFADLRPGAQLVRLTYVIVMALMTLLITFAAVWLGFYVARAITGPIQSLAEATREVALGNYNVSLSPRTDDEAGQLVRSFNQMTRDLRKHKHEAEESQHRLQDINEEIEQRRRYMEIVLKNITSGVIAVDPRDHVKSMNDAAERLLDVHALDSIGKSMASVMPLRLYEDFWKPMVSRLVPGSPTFSGQIEVEIAGKTVTLLADATHIRDDNNVDLGIVVVLDDATEQVKAQRVAAWREVARRIAHEVKNPITPIKLNTERLLRRFSDHFTGDDREVFVSCAETILVQVESLRTLVNEFSKFSRLPSVQTRLGDLTAVIRDVIDLFQHSYPDITFETAGLSKLPEIAIDPEQMNRVFVNLVANSIAAFEGTSKPWTITFESSVLREAQAVRVELSDTGKGIPDKIKNRVLEPYFSTKSSGTGLGLAIVNQIISDHGGYLRIADNHPSGVRVVIELPAAGTVT